MILISLATLFVSRVMLDVDVLPLVTLTLIIF